MTNREYFVALQNLVDVADITEDERKDFSDFLTKKIESIDKRKTAPKKPSEQSLKNDGYKADILASLAEVDKAVTIKELQGITPSIAEESNQRIARLLKDLRDEHQVKRTEVKRVAYFELGDEHPEGEEAAEE